MKQNDLRTQLTLKNKHDSSRNTDITYQISSKNEDFMKIAKKRKSSRNKEKIDIENTSSGEHDIKINYKSKGNKNCNKRHQGKHNPQQNLGHTYSTQIKNMGHQKRARQPSKRQHNVYELNAISQSQMEKLEKEVGYLKLSDFTLLREKYDTRNMCLTSLNHQLAFFQEKYQNEIKKEKKDQDKDVVRRYQSLETEVKTLTKNLDDIEKKIMKMLDTPSPFSIRNIKMPKLGTEDTYNHKDLEILPYSDEKTSVREVWNFLVEVGEDLKLSEKGFKRALWSRLTSEQRDSFDTYKEQPLKEAIQSLINHYDNPMKTYHYVDLITNFKRKQSENITNSIYRLLSYVEKAFRNPLKKKNEDEDLKVLRIRTLEDKLRGMCGTQEMFKGITKKLDKIREQNKTPTVTDIIQAAQLEEEIHERSEMDKLSLELNNINVRDESEVLALETENDDQNMDTQYQEFSGTQDSPDLNERQYHNSWANRSGWHQNQVRDYNPRKGMNQQHYNGNYGMGNHDYNPNSDFGHRRYNGYRGHDVSYQYHRRDQYHPSQYHGRGHQQGYKHRHDGYRNNRYNEHQQEWNGITQRVFVNNLEETEKTKQPEEQAEKKDEEENVESLVY